MKISSVRIVGPLAVIVACLIPSLANAQTVVNDNWLGGTGDWSDATKWSAGVVPNNSSDGTVVYDVTIASGLMDAVTVDVSSAIYINSLTIGSATGHTSTLTAANTPWFGVQNGNLTVNKTGKVENRKGVVYFTVGGDTTVIGTISGTDKLAMIVNSLINSGSITLSDDAQIQASSVENSGTLTLNGFASMYGGEFTQTNGTTTVANPNAYVKTLNLNVNGGVVKGSGLLFGNVNLSGTAKIIPITAEVTTPTCKNCWFSLGIIGGTYTQGSTSEISVDASPLSGGKTSLGLNVSMNTAALGGKLILTLVKGVSPPVGQPVTILSASSFSGTFTDLQLPPLPDGETWSVTYGDTDVTATVKAAE